MDQRRSDSTSDLRLEHEIERALAIEPSPAFLARVQARVAERAPAPWRVHWMPTIAVAAVLLFILGGGLLHRMRPQKAVATEPLIVARAIQAPVISLAPASTGGSLKTVRPRGAEVRNQFERPEIEPEVLLDRGEWTALRRLVRGRRGVAVGPLVTSEPETIASVETSEIVVRPLRPVSSIVIEPLQMAAREEGVRQ